MKEAADEQEQELSAMKAAADEQEQELSVKLTAADEQEQELSAMKAAADQQEQELSTMKEAADQQKQELSAMKVAADQQKEELFAKLTAADEQEQELTESKALVSGGLPAAPTLCSRTLRGLSAALFTYGAGSVFGKWRALLTLPLRDVSGEPGEEPALCISFSRLSACLFVCFLPLRLFLPSVLSSERQTPTKEGAHSGKAKKCNVWRGPPLPILPTNMQFAHGLEYKRKRTAFTRHMILELEKEFLLNQYLTGSRKKDIALRTGAKVEKVENEKGRRIVEGASPDQSPGSQSSQSGQVSGLSQHFSHQQAYSHQQQRTPQQEQQKSSEPRAGQQTSPQGQGWSGHTSGFGHLSGRVVPPGLVPITLPYTRAAAGGTRPPPNPGGTRDAAQASQTPSKSSSFDSLL
ncbi:hypothetical protein C7M84_016012 [Penaeus vannamei]|uniref:Homeobox domain-containing protein n=1 Tax=Penaeus vannamei TaxID=6689 RepID=A0A423SP45_PENVA|nr:hypothetical protein C7M84_016012 [Penaeus vannamei]